MPEVRKGNGYVRRLYIHCGLAKTGTTSLQDYLAQRRVELLALGFCYPAIGINKRGIAQQDLASAILRNDGTDAPDGARQDLIETLKAKDRAPSVVISSESFSSCLGNKRARPKFLDFIRELRQHNDEVYAVFTVRTFWKHMESSYLERLKKASPGKKSPSRSTLTPTGSSPCAKASRYWAQNWAKSASSRSMSNTRSQAPSMRCFRHWA
jgi:hypothetical protein